jgi:hypothetical protein
MDYSASTVTSMVICKQPARHLQGVQSAQVGTEDLNANNRQTQNAQSAIRRATQLCLGSVVCTPSTGSSRARQRLLAQLSSHLQAGQHRLP